MKKIYIVTRRRSIGDVVYHPTQSVVGALENMNIDPETEEGNVALYRLCASHSLTKLRFGEEYEVDVQPAPVDDPAYGAGGFVAPGAAQETPPRSGIEALARLEASTHHPAQRILVAHGVRPLCFVPAEWARDVARNPTPHPADIAAEAHTLAHRDTDVGLVPAYDLARSLVECDRLSAALQAADARGREMHRRAQRAEGLATSLLVRSEQVMRAMRSDVVRVVLGWVPAQIRAHRARPQEEQK